MHRLNTTSGPRDVPEVNAAHTLNTTENTYLDEEPEVAFVVPAQDWYAVVAGEVIPLVAFAVLDDGNAYGVAVSASGAAINMSESVEDREGFQHYDKKEK